MAASQTFGAFRISFDRMLNLSNPMAACGGRPNVRFGAPSLLSGSECFIGSFRREQTFAVLI